MGGDGGEVVVGGGVLGGGDAGDVSGGGHGVGGGGEEGGEHLGSPVVRSRGAAPTR